MSTTRAITFVVEDEPASSERGQGLPAGSGRDARPAKPDAEPANVRCLACGVLYHKPLFHHDCVTSDGCPQCGYVGWRTVAR